MILLSTILKRRENDLDQNLNQQRKIKQEQINEFKKVFNLQNNKTLN